MLQSVQCPFCFEKFSIEIYQADGEEQSFVYDCEVCCHPIDISVRFLSEEEIDLSAEKSDGF